MDPIILIFVVIAAASVGFLLGFLVRYLIEADDADKAGAVPKPDAKKAPQKSWIEVANLWRDRRDGRLIFQIEDQHYKRGDELTIREREILLKIVMDFYRWLEPPSATVSSPETPASPDGARQGRLEQDAALRESAPVIIPQDPLNQLASPTTEVKPPPGILAQGFISANVNVPETPSLSMVEQVNKILQEKIEAANMQKWAIRLIEAPNKGMVVWVGMERYEWIDEVPYKRVRDIIHESVAEWERRTEAGDTG
jgi:hypothetical protein